jgi:HD-GYP domain-containing protein (c-di-GMP phosphodiesterase class II)
MSVNSEPKTVDYYLKLNYRIAIYRDEEGDYIAEVEGLPGCIADGNSPAEAYDRIRQAMRSWIESRLEAGLEIYEPEAELEQYSGKLLLRIPKYLHHTLANQARGEGVSLNQYLLARLAEASGTNNRLGIRSMREALAELERSYDITLEMLADTLDADRAGHSLRVTAYAIAICRGMGLGREATYEIARAAFVHDIGLMAVPESILLKPGPLTARERSLVDQHCLRGYEFLSRIPFLRTQAELVYSHHEHFDGSGYPRGLAAASIPLGARIISVAETLDDLTSDRPHHLARSFAVAVSEIKRCSGSHFDPSVVKVVVSMPQGVWRDLKREVGKDKFHTSPSQTYIDAVCERIAAVSQGTAGSPTSRR